MHPSVSFNTSFSQKWITYQSCARRALSSRISRAIFFRFWLSSTPGYVSASTCVLPSSAHAKTRRPRRMAILYFRIAISGEPGSRLSFNLYLNPRCHRRFAKRTSALPCFGGHETSVWMFAGVVSYDFGCLIWFYHRI